MIIAGNFGLRFNLEHRNHAPFGDGIRNWFRNMREKLGFGRDSSNQIELPIPLDLNSGPSLKFYRTAEDAPSDRLMIQPRPLFLDLSEYILYNNITLKKHSGCVI